MPMPPEVQYASEQFMGLLRALKDRAFLETHNQCYAMLRAVLHEFRSYMTIKQAIAFADGLPPVARAIFIEGWQPADEPTPPPSRREFDAAGAKRLLPHHYAPDSLVGDVFAVFVSLAAALLAGLLLWRRWKNDDETRLIEKGEQ